MTQALRVGVIGASVGGGWAMQSHVPAIAHLDAVELRALATSRTESAMHSAAVLGVPHGYASARELARDADIDLVTVAVKVPAHAEAVTEAVRAGKDVYCEWPLGTNTEQAKTLRDLADAAGVRTVIGLQARLTPAVRAARDLVADGTLGRILSVQAFSAGLGLGGPSLPADREWAADIANGLSVMTVRTAHTLDAVEFIAGSIVELSAEVVIATPDPVIAGTARVARKTAPDQVLVFGRLAGGASLSAQFLLGVNPPHLPLITVMGTLGTLSLMGEAADDQIQMSRITLLVGLGTEAPVAVTRERASAADDLPDPAAGVARMYEAIRDGIGGLPDFTHAVLLHQLLDTIAEAAATGRRLDLISRSRRKP